MHTLSRRNTLVLALALSALMWATRGHHFMSVTHLPDASWAIFFLLGFYFRQKVMILPLFLAQAAVIDYVSITHFGVDDYCVTSAYPFLLPAYSALWLAGRWCAIHIQQNVRGLPWFAAAASVGCRGGGPPDARQHGVDQQGATPIQCNTAQIAGEVLQQARAKLLQAGVG